MDQRSKLPILRRKDMGRVASNRIGYQTLVSKINAAKSTDKIVTITCGDALVMRIMGKERSAHWYCRDDKRKLVRIGDFPAMSLADAHHQALIHIDPNYEKKKVKLIQKTVEEPDRTPTFGEIAEAWLSTKQTLGRYKNIRKSVDYMRPLFSIPINEIRNSKIKEVLLTQDITPYKIKESVSHLINIMDYAVEEEAITSHNCYILRKSPSFPKVMKGAGYKWVPLERFPELFARLENLQPWLKRYFLLLVLTCVRPGECRQLKFEYMNERDKCIEIPGNIMKVKESLPFRVPVTKQIKILWQHIKEDNKRSEYLFPRPTDKFPIVERDLAVPFSAVAGDLAHPHGFRKSARTFFAEIGVAYDVAAMCLAHRINTGADAVYQKSDMLELRRTIMERWSDEVQKRLPESFLIWLR